MIQYVLLLFGIIPTAIFILWAFRLVARFVGRWFALLIFNVLENGLLKAVLWVFLESVPEVLGEMVLTFQGFNNIKSEGEKWIYEPPFKYTRKQDDDE